MARLIKGFLLALIIALPLWYLVYRFLNWLIMNGPSLIWFGR